MRGTTSIRLAVEEDVPHLIRVEVGAGQLFHSVGMPVVAADVPDAADVHATVEAGHTWVAMDEGAVVGYISAEVLDGNAHIAQVSVVPECSGRRIGQGLIEHVEAWGRGAGLAATTLTTFLEVPWNEPYYRRLGYVVLHDHEIGPALSRTMRHEATLPGLDPAQRCAMSKPNQLRL